MLIRAGGGIARSGKGFDFSFEDLAWEFVFGLD